MDYTPYYHVYGVYSEYTDVTCYLFGVREKSRNGLFGCRWAQLSPEAAPTARVGGAEVLHHPATGADVKVGRPVDVGGAPRLSS